MRIFGAGAALALVLCLAPGVNAVRDEDQKDKAAAKEQKEKQDDKKAKKELKSYEIPYKFTSANHIVVRAKINGKGPFNFVLDTGAPALYVAVPVGKKANVKADDDGWADLDKFELEGGLVMKKARCRVETPFQLTGMNGLGLAGMEIHGLMGYNVLAQYRMTFDFTNDKLIFTELDYKPEQPFSLKGKAGGAIGGLEAMGQVMGMVGKLLKRKPTPDVTLRGFYGMTLENGDGNPQVTGVLEEGPAGEAGLKKGDLIDKVDGKEVKNVADLLAITSKSSGNNKVKLTVKRDGKFVDLTLETKEASEMYRILTVALVAAFVLNLGVAADEKKEEKKEEKNKEKPKASVVKFELLKSGHMAVDLKVNGKGPYTVIFDTGAPISLVNTKLAKEAGLLDGKEKKDPLEAMMEKLIGISGAGEKKVKTLEIGDAKVEDVTVMVMDHPTVAAISKALDKPIMGLVGFPFFARFEMTLDYQKKTMTLRPNGYKPVDSSMTAMTKAIMEGPAPKTLAPSAQWGLVCAKDRGDEADGVDVKLVVPDGAAAKGGVKKGDRLLTLDGRWTDSVEDLYEAASYVKAGRKVKVKVKREGKEVVLEVTPAKGM